MIQALKDLLLTLINYLPWMLIGLMAGWSLYKHKDSKILLLQAAGAVGMVLLGLLDWFVISLLTWFQWFGALHAAQIIFSFLLFLSLLTFALGYCLERFRNRKAMVVTAKIIDPAK